MLSGFPDLFGKEEFLIFSASMFYLVIPLIIVAITCGAAFDYYGDNKM